MGYWGKIIGGVAGFAMGGPVGAVVGAALGHAADSGGVPNVRLPFGPPSSWNPARVAAMFNRRDQLFAICVVVLSAKLAKCDGAVKREEIDAFRRQFRIPPEAVRDRKSSSRPFTGPSARAITNSAPSTSSSMPRLSANASPSCTA